MQIQAKKAAILRITDEPVTIRSVYSSLATLEQEYPDFKKWFFNSVVPELKDGRRNLFVACYDKEVAGILITKDSNEEKKICTLRVSPEYRNVGIGTQLMAVAISTLNTSRPLITVSDDHISEFIKLFNRFGFILNSIHVDYYRQGHIEYAFNGTL